MFTALREQCVEYITVINFPPFMISQMTDQFLFITFYAKYQLLLYCVVIQKIIILFLWLAFCNCCSSGYRTDPVFAVGCCSDPKVIRNSHPLVVSHEVHEVPRLLSVLLVHIGIERQAVQLTVLLCQEKEERMILSIFYVFNIL